MTLKVNVGSIRALYAPADLAVSGTDGVRCTFHFDAEPGSVRRWIEDCHAHTLTVLMALDNDAHDWGADIGGLDPVRAELKQWTEGCRKAFEAYGDLVDEWQLCNEPDAGWTPGDDCPSLEARKAHHPSSWVMHPQELSDHLALAREAMGQAAILVGPGLCSGHPSWATQVTWRPVQRRCVHPYAKHPDTPELEAMLAGYAELGPYTISEYDARTPGMHAWMAGQDEACYAFCWSDQMGVDGGFGLLDAEGNPKPSFNEFVLANQDTGQGHPPPPAASEADCIAEAERISWSLLNPYLEYSPESAMARTWRTHRWIGSPIAPELYARDDGGATTAAVQPFANAVLVWHPGDDLATILGS